MCCTTLVANSIEIGLIGSEIFAKCQTYPMENFEFFGVMLGCLKPAQLL